MASPLIVYFSSVSENTHRFVEKLQMRSVRIPLIDRVATQTPEGPRASTFTVDEPFILITPTYGGGKVAHPNAATGQPGGGGYVPKQVIRFLNNTGNRTLIRAVIAAGNTNFGEEFCMAGNIISNKCDVPYLYRFELMGTSDDVQRVRGGLTTFANSARFRRDTLSSTA